MLILVNKCINRHKV